MVGLCAVPSGIQLFALHWLPESPRYLLSRSKEKEANHVLSRVYPYINEEDLRAKVNVLQVGVKKSLHIAKTVPLHKRIGYMFSNPG